MCEISVRLKTTDSDLAGFFFPVRTEKRNCANKVRWIYDKVARDGLGLTVTRLLLRKAATHREAVVS